MPESGLEHIFAIILEEEGLHPEREYVFSPPRKWRFDFAWPDRKVALEIEGGSWSEGRHNRGAGFELDCRKYNRAAVMGWCVLRVTASMIKSLEALQVLREALEGHNA